MTRVEWTMVRDNRMDWWIAGLVILRTLLGVLGSVSASVMYNMLAIGGLAALANNSYLAQATNRRQRHSECHRVKKSRTLCYQARCEMVR